MYGRCETDPFDQASDVCDSCYGEFCSACMVKTKGRKRPICKECTIIASGVRPGAKPLLRGSKKTAAKRRKALQQAPEISRAFEYFDDAKPSADPGSGSESESESESGPESESESESEPETSEPASDPVVERTEPAPAPEPSSVRSVTPGLAALAQHQAERNTEPEDDPASVPAPDWLTTSVDGAIPFAEPSTDDHDRTEIGAEWDDAGPFDGDPFGETSVDDPPVDGPPIDRPPGDERSDDATTDDRRGRRIPIDDGAKPVTEGFDWVAEMPARGTSTPLPSRARPDGGKPAAERSGGAVATAEPPAALPRRRSTLRAPDDNRR